MIRIATSSRIRLGLPWLVLGIAASSAGAADGLPASAVGMPTRSHRTPAEALAEFRIDAGLRLELVAAEPEVESPVAIAFDESGRLWVAEMRDYPLGPSPGSEPEGRIKVLEDRDGDGRYESARVFAEGLRFVNGVLPWRGGAIATAATQVVLLPDADRDGRADRPVPLFEGFSDKNAQLLVGHPTLGIDNLVYVANGLRSGQVRDLRSDDTEAIEIGGSDFRFDPLGDRAESVAGMGQYGLGFDDRGHRFVCDNRHHLRHAVLPTEATNRNPDLAVGPVVQDLPETDAGARIYPLSKNWTTSSLHVGQFTAACGVTLYRGDLLPPPYRGAAFTCDPTGNLVHMEILEPDGASFRSKAPHPGAEFLASPDDWFRPVNLANGLDGALYVVDMARAVIEHPEFMPPELKQRPDLLLGKDRGRIWRIVPDRPREASPRPDLGGAKTAELVELLGHPNAWWRTTAQRLLLERADPSATAPLRDLVDRIDASPLARVHAAWLLETRGDLEDASIAKLLEANAPGLLENAVRLATTRVDQSMPIRERLIGLATHEDPKVRFQVAIALGAWDDPRTLGPLARIALAGASDRWTRLAVEGAVPGRAGALIATLLGPNLDLAAKPDPDRLQLLRELASLIGARRDPAEVVGVLEAIVSLDVPDAARWGQVGLDGLAEGMGRRGTRLDAFLAKLPKSDPLSDRVARLAGPIAGLYAHAAAVAEDADRLEPERSNAIRLLAHAPWGPAGSVLGRLLIESPSQEIRVSAARALSAQTAPESARMLMDAWPSATPAVRREILTAMTRRADRVGVFLGALEAGRVAPGDLDAAATRLLIDHPRPEVRDRARNLLKDRLPEGRREALARYQPAVDREGDVARGRAVFGKACATCHRVDGLGLAVGPDIGDTRTKTRAMLLTDILNPNGAIDGNYINYVVSLRDGRVVNGLIAAESAGSLTLRRAEDQTEVVLRQDVDEVRSTGASLMPEGLEQSITIDEMTDLLSFLKNWRYADGQASTGTEASDQGVVR